MHPTATYAIGVFTGFTISQAGLVRRWQLHAALNGTGAILTATATAVFTRSVVGQPALDLDTQS